MFGRRKQQEREEAAREAERRALFEELAKRPDTVCPFLGLADARTEYRDRVSDAHRCYAFGDPAELSAEQQQKVCLQRGYGNCPRYLRGVLVIPTEELEALRRPQPVPPAPQIAPRGAPASVEPASQGGRRRAAVMLVGVVLLLAALGGAGYWYLRNYVPSSVATAVLPGGTDVSAEVVSLSPPNDGSQQLRAVAEIGAPQAVEGTTIIYVLDVSRTTQRGNGCGGDINVDGRPDTVLDCEIASAERLNAEAIGRGSVEEVGLVGFAAGAVTADLAPASGAQSRISPEVDDDDDQLPNVVEAMRSAFTGRTATDPVGFREYSDVTTRSPTTEFSSGITAACQALAEATTPNRIIVFLSDGLNRSGAHVSEVLPCSPEAVFYTFAVGRRASCSEEPDVGGLQTMADLTGGTCTDVPDLSQLPAILGAVVLPQLVEVELSVDGGEPVDITAAATPSLPRTAPASVNITYELPALPPGEHELCISVVASDAGGAARVESCATATSEGGRLTSD
ncbi:MAG TPA: hypothetical protein VHK63_02855 [Candidatus Limnocylindria bacterium]|nr:hypothetical protein [Candidatus Limnocylindria bacterium]